MRRLTTLLKRLIILGLIAAPIWYVYSYFHISEEEKRLARPAAEKLFRVSAEQVDRLTRTGKRHNRVSLLYIFRTNCLICRWHFKDIIDFSQQYSRRDLNILVISMDEDPLTLAAYLRKFGKLSFPVLLLKDGEQSRLLNYLRPKGSEYDGTLPHIVVIDKTGRFIGIPFGWDRSSRINQIILDAYDSKQ